MSDIGWASLQLQAGKCVKRELWHDQYLDGAVVNHDNSLMILVFTVSIHQVGFWVPNSHDIIASDWVDADPPEADKNNSPIPATGVGPKIM